MEAFLQFAHQHIFDSYILDTVDNRMALLESSNLLELTTSHIVNSNVWWKAIGACEPVEKGASGRDNEVKERNSQFLLLLAVPLRPLCCCCFEQLELHSTSN